jgi:hypothetical protein
MSAFNEAAGKLFSKGFEAAISRWDTARPDDRDFHVGACSAC